MERVLNTLGLVAGIVGVVLIFYWGPPQPILDPGIGLALESGTPIDESGKTVAAHDAEVRTRRKTHEFISSLGLLLVAVGFAFQLAAIWLPSYWPANGRASERPSGTALKPPAVQDKGAP